MDDQEIDVGGGSSETEREFNTLLKQLELIRNELGSKGGPGDNPGWIEDYVYRLHEVAEGLHKLAMANSEGNPSQGGYP